MANTMTGVIKEIYPTKTVSDKFRTRQFVLTENSGKFAQYITFETANDKCDVLDGARIGDEVTVTFDIRGREYAKDGVTKYFNQLSAWKIEGISSSPSDSVEPPTIQSGDESSDLPF